MAGSIKLFQFIQSLFQTMGIYSPQPDQHRFTFNSRNIFFLLGIASFSIGHCGYFLTETTFESFYRSTTQVNALIDVILNIWRMPIILHLIDICEKFINRSKYQINAVQFIFATNFLVCVSFSGLQYQSTSAISYNSMYGDSIEKIERMSKFVHFVLVVSWPGTVISLVYTVLTNYFVLNLGNDSYEDPLIMYVQNGNEI